MSQQNATSLSLLERVRHQDDQAWQRLVALYGPLVRFWCQRWGASVSDAEDVAQDVFLAVAKSLSEFERRHDGSFRGWIRGITRHKLLDHQRRLQRQPEAAGGTEANLLLQEHADADVGDDVAEISALYRRALELIRGQFEEKTWLAFWGAAVEGRPTDMIARDLGLSVVAVRIAKSRVLARLREEMQGLID